MGARDDGWAGEGGCLRWKCGEANVVDARDRLFSRRRARGALAGACANCDVWSVKGGMGLRGGWLGAAFANVPCVCTEREILRKHWQVHGCIPPAHASVRFTETRRTPGPDTLTHSHPHMKPQTAPSHRGYVRHRELKIRLIAHARASLNHLASIAEPEDALRLRPQDICRCCVEVMSRSSSSDSSESVTSAPFASCRRCIGLFSDLALEVLVVLLFRELETLDAVRVRGSVGVRRNGSTPTTGIELPRSGNVWMVGEVGHDPGSSTTSTEEQHRNRPRMMAVRARDWTDC